jgi:hypothetical protein
MHPPRYRLRTLMLAVAALGAALALLRSDSTAAVSLVLVAGSSALLVCLDAPVRRSAGLTTDRHQAIKNVRLSAGIAALLLLLAGAIAASVAMP